MQDPFGNEFCLVRVLNRAERAALDAAAEHGPADDAHWRAVACARHQLTGASEYQQRSTPGT
jgi:hypothetical protein